MAGGRQCPRPGDDGDHHVVAGGHSRPGLKLRLRPVGERCSPVSLDIPTYWPCGPSLPGHVLARRLLSTAVKSLENATGPAVYEYASDSCHGAISALMPGPSGGVAVRRLASHIHPDNLGSSAGIGTGTPRRAHSAPGERASRGLTHRPRAQSSPHAAPYASQRERLDIPGSQDERRIVGASEAAVPTDKPQAKCTQPSAHPARLALASFLRNLPLSTSSHPPISAQENMADGLRESRTPRPDAHPKKEYGYDESSVPTSYV
jgi:hypothetical protein